MTSYRLHAARKWHTCAECHRQIKPGTRYLYGFAVLDGLRTWAHFCERCCTNDFHRDGSLGRAWEAARSGLAGAVRSPGEAPTGTEVEGARDA